MNKVRLISLASSMAGSSGDGGKPNMELGIGTINAKTLWYDDDGRGEIKLYHIIYEMRFYGIDVMGVSETQWFGRGSFYVQYDEHSWYSVLYYGKEKKQSPKFTGVAVILSPKAQLFYKSYQPLLNQDEFGGRLMSVSLTNTDILVMYAPHKRADRKAFKTEFDQVLKEFTERPLILMGDFNEDNDHIGQKKNEQYPLILSGHPEFKLQDEAEGFIDHILYKENGPLSGYIQDSHTRSPTVVYTDHQSIARLKWRITVEPPPITLRPGRKNDIIQTIHDQHNNQPFLGDILGKKLTKTCLEANKLILKGFKDLLWGILLRKFSQGTQST